MKFNFYLFLAVFFIFPHVICNCEAYEKDITQALIKKTEPRGFDKSMLESLPPYRNKKFSYYYSNGVSLKKNQIREFDYLPENKPSGFEISENIFIRPRVSVSYLRGMVEDLNSIIGFYNNSVQNELDERLGKTDESSTEGGIELSWYF